MPTKTVTFNENAREKLLQGVQILAKAVKSTLGPKGRNVIIQTPTTIPQVTKDGVTVAKHIELDDNIQNLGAELVKQASSQTHAAAGDGTTSSTVLTEAMVTKAHKYIQGGANPIDINRGLTIGLEEAIKFIDDNRVLVKEDPKKVKQVATISSNNDTKLGTLISDTLLHVGEEGVVAVETARSHETTVEYVEGARYEKGWVSPYFINNPDMTCIFENPHILVSNRKIDSNTEHLIKFLENVRREDGLKGGYRPILIIADDIEAQALSFLLNNKVRSGLEVCVVKAPAYGDRRRKLLDDIAVLTGATLLSDHEGISLPEVTTAQLGSCDKVIIADKTTSIIKAHGSKDKLKERLEEVREELKASTTEWDKLKNQERLAKLQGKAAIIYAGAPIESELQEVKDRIDDALHATKAAIKSGIVPGGGTAFLNAYKALNTDTFTNEDIKLGYQIFKESLKSITQTIMDNAGLEPSVIINNILKSKSADYGYDAHTNTYVNMMTNGIIDPTAVVTSALRNAVSSANMINITEVTVTNNPPKAYEHQHVVQPY